jgi:hypothetical protein
MLTLREMLIGITTQNNNIVSKAFAKPKISKITSEIELKYSRSENPPEFADQQQIRNIFLLAEKNNSWDMVNKKTWKKACWVLWSGDEQLASNKIFLKKYFEYCNSHSSSRNIKSLIHAYLRDFKKSMPGQAEVSNFIREKLSIPRFENLLSLWVERDKKHALFDIKKDFIPNALDYIYDEQDAKNYLTSLGLDGQLEMANYSQEIFEAIAHEVEKIITRSEAALELFCKLEDIAVIKSKDLRYPQKKYILIESLLRPWLGKTPPSDLCKKIIEFLLKHFYDPRTIEGRFNWVGVSEESLKVIRKWLARKTLEQFFEIIKKTAKDNHWNYRHKFWKAYYDAGYIDDAWVALGKDSRTEARFHSTNENELIAGNVKGSGVKADHSVLIFKVGGLTISEWSHDGKCRVWYESNRTSPKLYEDFYQAEQLREHENFSIPHHSSERYNWQNKLSDYIEHHTGIRMSRQKYEVK